MATIRPGVFTKLLKDESRKADIIEVNVNIAETDIRTKVVEVVKSAKELLDIGEATVIVSGGRGVGPMSSS
jgi:electron transfer flavoprotein alpha subunit